MLLEVLSVAANLAMPVTLGIDPMAPEMRERVDGTADDAGLAADRLDAVGGRAVGIRSPARCTSHAPCRDRARASLMLEHPTALDQAGESAAFGDTLRTLSATRGFGWIAISEDEAFARRPAGRVLRLDPATGRIEGRSEALVRT